LALGVTPLRVGQEAYWLDQIAHDRCEYYSGKGESPGWWAGSLAERTGLNGVAEDEAVQQLFAGQDPLSGEQRVVPLWRADPRSRLDAGPLQAALRELAASRGVEVSELATGERGRKRLQSISGTRKVSALVVERLCRTVLDRNPEELYGDAYAEAREHVGKRIDARVASFDLSFSDPKSVSLLAAGSSSEVRAEVQAARHVAIRKVLGWLEQEAVGVAEIDLHAGVDGELHVFGHLPTVVPGDGAAQLLGQPHDRSGERRTHVSCGEAVREREQQHIAAVPLDQGPHRAGPPAEDQVAFPMPRHRPVGRLRRSLANVEGVPQLAAARGESLAPR
jgi:TrwC relaxase